LFGGWPPQPALRSGLRHLRAAALHRGPPPCGVCPQWRRQDCEPHRPADAGARAASARARQRRIGHESVRQAAIGAHTDAYDLYSDEQAVLTELRQITQKRRGY